MNKAKSLFIILFFSFFIYLKGANITSGIRISTYGIKPLPEMKFWIKGLEKVNSNFKSSKKAVILVVGSVKNKTSCLLHFPMKKRYSFISTTEEDIFEKYLNYFDKSGVDVWLQIEPANADVITLIKLVLNNYSHHKSVVGIGVDVEWYKWTEVKYGMRVTDSKAMLWEKIVKSYNKRYKLFLKHWKVEKMPPHYRGDIVFVSDSQKFNNIDELMDDFIKWAKTFYPNKVAFQIGYPKDEIWWGKFKNPIKEIGETIFRNIPNTTGIFWVDFSLKKIVKQNM